VIYSNITTKSFMGLKTQKSMKLFAISCAVVTLLLQGVTGGEISKEVCAESAIEPAVSAVNGKIDGHYGEVNGSSTRGVAGSLSLPLGERYGFQFDTIFEHGMQSDIYGLGSHLFTRRPDKGLLGFAFGFAESTDFTDAIAGVEAERYLCKVTLGGFIGYNNFDTHITPFFAPEIENETDYLAGRLYAAIYPCDDLMVRLEYQHRVDHNFFIANVEYQTQIKGLALFAEGGVGENDYSHVLGGIRLYFGGGCKSLKDRHRKDDPDNILSVFGKTGMATGSNPGFSPAAPADGGGEVIDAPPPD
jgi:hypothetical protein